MDQISIQMLFWFFFQLFFLISSFVRFYQIFYVCKMAVQIYENCSLLDMYSFTTNLDEFHYLYIITPVPILMIDGTRRSIKMTIALVLYSSRMCRMPNCF